MGLTTSSWNRVPLISGGCAAPPHLCFGRLRKGVSHEVGFNSLHRFRVQRLTFWLIIRIGFWGSFIP